MAENANETPKSFKDTLNLPHTDFPIRANPAVDDPIMLERWIKQDLFRTSFDAHSGNTKFILHDGPPYANGHIHLGHAYNKILKDMVTKAHRMMGYHVPVMPGWDCHGLPIELKVAQEKPGLDRISLIKACRENAQRWIDVQRGEFKELGVLMDWDRPYTTMSTSYEASTVRAFGMLVENAYIERKNKTVPWCASCQTVLATAEIEHKERKDPSIYVAFDLDPADTKRLFPDINGKVSIAVWTTTPWTLPLNQAVLAKPGAEYVLISRDVPGQNGSSSQYCLVGAKSAAKLAALMERAAHPASTHDSSSVKNATSLPETPVIVHTVDSKRLEGLKVFHPFVNKKVPVILDESVGTDEGTAFVHCAPGCGPSDYEIGVKKNLEIYSPLTSDGRYSDLIVPQELAGMPVTDGQGWVIKKLMEQQTLLYKGSITHSYPHCWRCRNGLIFRATPQWFFDLEKNNIRERVLKAINSITFIPSQASSFLRATVENRWEWCLSRQRVWGAPIPALLCNGCDFAYLDNALITKVAQGIERDGIEYWEKVRVDELIGTLVCPHCKTNDFRKETDILDVWFESGISHFAVLYKNDQLAYPADIYLEGVDQHRAWFQSSLIMSMVLEEEPCMKTIMSHGYTVDAKGQKMSKSLGNVVSPADIIKQVGTDGLRLWVSSIGHESDPVVSDVLLRNVAEVHRKIRNTCRFLLSTLADFDMQKDAVPAGKLLPIDQYALSQLDAVNSSVIQAYGEADFSQVFHTLSQYCSVELSAFYVDVTKDRLYCEKADSFGRRSAQTVLWQILDTLTRLIAPILSFTAEQVSDYYQKDKESSIHLQRFTDPRALHAVSYPRGEELWPDNRRYNRGTLTQLTSDIEEQQKELAYATQWQTLKDIRSVLLKAIELEREKGLIKHSLEAKVTAYIDMKKPEFAILADLFEQMKAQGQTPEAFFKDFLIVSQFIIAHDRGNLKPSTDEGIAVLVEQAEGNKCPRCWQFDLTLNPDHLCRRCERVLQS